MSLQSFDQAEKKRNIKGNNFRLLTQNNKSGHFIPKGLAKSVRIKHRWMKYAVAEMYPFLGIDCGESGIQYMSHQ